MKSKLYTVIKVGNNSKQAPIPCPLCKYPMEFGAVQQDNTIKCRACWEEDHGMSHNDANRFRYVRPEFAMYPNAGQKTNMPRNLDAWSAYYDMNKNAHDL